jgi:adenine phosphoribosyltransferase
MTAPERDLDALLSRLVRDVPDFPEPGVLFKDICPLLADADGFTAFVAALAAIGRRDDGAVGVDKVAGVEARGFILAAPVALALEVGLVPVRKAGKLPGPTHRESYALEYGEATLEVQQDAFRPGDRVLVVDDVLATGGTLRATSALVERGGAQVVAVAVLIELASLSGRETLAGTRLESLLTV